MSNATVISKKNMIRQTAIELFYSNGFNATSTAEIAVKAGVAEATIFRHFKTKKGLLLSLLEEFLELFGREIVVYPIKEISEKNKDSEIKDVLKMIMKDRLLLFEQNSELVWIIITEMKYHPEIKIMFHEKIAEEAASILNGIFEDGIKHGVFRDCAPETILKSFIGTLVGILLPSKAFPQLFPQTKGYDDQIDEALDLFLNGVAVKGGGL